MIISTYTYKGTDIHGTLLKGVLEVVFTVNGQKYGQKVKIQGQKKMAIVDATATLIIWAVQSIDSLTQ
jgi:hypothetical protein